MGWIEERHVGYIGVYKCFVQDAVDDGMGEGAVKVLTKG